jgi:hypothetical protein
MGRPNPGTGGTIVLLKTRLLLLVCCWCSLSSRPAAAEGWQEALRGMPLDAETALNRDNCLPILLRAFQSNAVVKALVFLPAVADDFYLINRDQPKLNVKAANLLAAITALTNATAVRATFQAPLLLLHLDRDELRPGILIKHKPTAEALKHQGHLPHALFIDAHWQQVQSSLRGALKMEVVPAAQSIKAWHFARHNLAAWDLADWDLLAALSLSGRTTVSIQKHRLFWQEMPR